MSLSIMYISFHYESRLEACYFTIVRHPLVAFSGGYPFFSKRCTYYWCGRIASYGGGGYVR